MSYIFGTLKNYIDESLSPFGLARDVLGEPVYSSEVFSQLRTIKGKWDEEENAYIFSLEFPGYSKKDLLINYNKHEKLIKIIAKNDEMGTKTKSVLLNGYTQCDLSKTKASIKNGILYLVIPINKDPEKNGKIPVN